LKLRSKIILILLFVSVVPLFVVNYMDTKSDRAVLEKQFGAEGVEMGHQVVSSIYVYLDSVCEEIHALSHSIPKEVFTEGKKGKGRDLFDRATETFRKVGPKYSFIRILDKSGKLISSSPRSSVKDFSDLAGFATALGGNIVIQQPANVQHPNGTRPHRMKVFLPIVELGEHGRHSYATEHNADEVLGVIMVNVKWRRISRRVTRVRLGGEKNLLSQDNYVILINDKGLVLSGSEPNMAFTTNLVDLGMLSAAKAVKGEDGYILEANEHGKESFISYHSSHTYKGSDVPDLGWSVLVVRDPKVVFASVYTMRRIMLWTLAIIVLVLIPVSIIISGRLTRPILALSEAAKAFGEGDLSRRVEINRRDEIGTLGVSFNSMAEQIEKYRGSLEEVVRTRTVELEKANAELIVRMEELGHSDEALRRSEEKYRMLVENVDLGVVMMDADHNILFVNSVQCRMFGKKSEDMIGKKCYWEFKKRKSPCGYCPGDLAMKTGKAETVEIEGILADGGYRSVQLMASPLYDHENKPRGFIEIVEDISERKHVERELHDYQEQLRSLASKLTLSEEHERRRIAGGLHDSIIQPLVFIKMKLETLLNKAEDGEKLSASMIRMRDEVAQLITMTREFTFDLSYPILYEFGLEAAMEEWLKEKVEGKYDLKTKFSDDGVEKPIGDDMRTFLFGAFRELLVNIIKHANAKEINVAVSADNGKITVRVEDDGIGFDCSETQPVMTKESGFGLFGIRDRLEYLGGNFKIESKVASGTVVTLCAPLRQDL